MVPQERIVESSLGRIWHYTENYDIAIISAFRDAEKNCFRDINMSKVNGRPFIFDTFESMGFGGKYSINRYSRDIIREIKL